MRALLLDTDEFESKVEEKSTRPVSIISEPVGENGGLKHLEQSLTVFFCVEEGDNISKLDLLYTEVVDSARDFGTNRIMVSPFAHLSKQPANPALAKELYERLVEKLKNKPYQVETSQFGYHKSLLLRVKGHPGSFRYREF